MKVGEYIRDKKKPPTSVFPQNLEFDQFRIELFPDDQFNLPVKKT